MLVLLPVEGEPGAIGWIAVLLEGEAWAGQVLLRRECCSYLGNTYIIIAYHQCQIKASGICLIFKQYPLFLTLCFNSAW